MDELSSIGTFLKDEIRARTGSAQSTFDLWFGDLTLTSLSEEKAVLTTPSTLRKNILSTRYIDILRESVEAVIGFSVEIEIVSLEEQPKSDSFSSEGDIIFSSESLEESKRSEKRIADILSDTSGDKKSLIDNYTFENFIEGDSNKLAKAMCYAVAKEPCSTSNPLFIYGNSGLGKTHLLYAIINYMKKNHPELKIVYKKSETFINELIDAIGNHETGAFKDKYRTADVLLIDDIQFLAGKESTQEEFFHTFNALYENEKQIILTSDRPAREIKPLTDRLRTRFEWGLIADIQTPSFELRTAIIKKKAEDMNLSLSPELINYMAERLNNNIRQVEGLIKKLYAISSLSGIEISKEIVEQAISVVDPGNIPTEALVDRIISAVGKRYGVNAADIQSKKKTDAVSKARHIAIYITRKLTDLSYKEIGKMFGRDHSTVVASFNKVEINIKTVNNYESDINSLIKEIKGK